MRLLCRTAVIVLPWIRSPSNRCPCVVIAIRSHCSLLGRLEDLVRRVAAARGGRRPCRPALAQRVGRRSRDSAVAVHLLGFGELELVEIARRPAVGDVHRAAARSRASARQLGDVRQQAFVRAAVLEGDENFLVHGVVTSTTRQPGRDAEEVRQVLHVQRDDDRGRDPGQDLDPDRVDELAHLAAVAREHDERETANESCRLRITWLRTSSLRRAALAVDSR